MISTEDMVRKIELACETRQSDAFLIVARTDARTEHGLDEALSRAEAYRSAGADVLFVESPESLDEMRMINEQLSHTYPGQYGGGRQNANACRCRAQALATTSPFILFICSALQSRPCARL